jgi:hypothetical protein
MPSCNKNREKVSWYTGIYDKEALQYFNYIPKQEGRKNVKNLLLTGEMDYFGSVRIFGLLSNFSIALILSML